MVQHCTERAVKPGVIPGGAYQGHNGSRTGKRIAMSESFKFRLILMTQACQACSQVEDGNLMTIWFPCWIYSGPGYLEASQAVGGDTDFVKYYDLV